MYLSFISFVVFLTFYYFSLIFKSNLLLPTGLKHYGLLSINEDYIF